MRFNPDAFQAIREGRGLSKAEVGREIGRDRTLITRYENGQRTPSIPDIVAMAKVLGVSTRAITGQGEDAPEAAA